VLSRPALSVNPVYTGKPTRMGLFEADMERGRATQAGRRGGAAGKLMDHGTE